MYTSGIEPQMRRRILACLNASALLLIASDIYQYFGHGVTSRMMSLSPLVPLFGGMLQLMVHECAHRGAKPSAYDLWMQNILFAGLSAIAAGMFLWGIVEIAGVDSHYPMPFLIVGGLMAACGSIGIWLPIFRRSEKGGFT